MAIREIVQWPDARLTTVCDPAAMGGDLAALTRDMFDTMYDANGRGLAAPQIGVMTRLFVMDVTWKEGDRSPRAFINPRMVRRSDVVGFGDEGCLSIPGIMVSVERPDWVDFEWTDGNGARQSQRLDGFAARCAQHELDHLNGIVTIQHLDNAARAAAETEYSQP